MAAQQITAAGPPGDAPIIVTLTGARNARVVIQPDMESAWRIFGCVARSLRPWS